jgi:hypothetical protein
MTEYIFKNGATGSLEDEIGTADIRFSLESGEGDSFPSPGSGQAFHIIVVEGSKSEWMVCTARSGDQLTVTRASSPQSFSAGAAVEHRLHEDALNAMMQKGDFRTVTTDPDGSLAASFDGEEVYNSVTGVWWKHCTGTTWKAMND